MAFSNEKLPQKLAFYHGTASTNPLMLRMLDLRSRAAELKLEFENLFAFHTALSLAFKERTGREPHAGEEFTVADEERAEEIFGLF